MNQDEYEKVERPALEQLQQLGWDYRHGSQLTPESGERASLREVVLTQRLEAAIVRINPWIDENNLRKVLREITHPPFAGLIEYNQALYRMLMNDVSVEQNLGKGRKGQTVTLIDFDHLENNEFLCTNQFTITGVNQTIIPDIIGFINGLPLVVIECKSPYSTNPMATAIDQLLRYGNLQYPEQHEGTQRLFWYNQWMIALCRDHAKVGTISSSATYYSDWKDAFPFTDSDLSGAATHPQQRLLAGLLSRANCLDILQNFMLYEPVEGRLIKKIARYQQFRAVNKIIHRLKHGADRKAKSGVVWHTQGSGKSLTMVMLAVKMRRDPALRHYKLVFITDRTELDDQLSRTFRHAQGEHVHNAASVAQLKRLLQKDASDLITATVQKFQDAQQAGGFENINPSDRIIVLADEAHRTQFGNLALTINTALPNAPKIGFTGTPLLKTQKMSTAFGGYIEQYTINEAVVDAATVRLLYTGRQVRTEVAGRSLDTLFETYFKAYSAQDKRAIKQKYGVERAVHEAPARIRWVCLDLLTHYREHIQPNGFKAMIVVGSRHAATLFKATLEELGAPPSAVIISAHHNDRPELAQYTDKSQHKAQIEAFTKPLSADPMTFLIVKDMLLTGFDAPIAQVMYIDRKLQDHTLMQAIARVNRTYPGKQCGYVVDYYGLSQELTHALAQFSQEDVADTYQNLNDEIPKLQVAHAQVMGFFDALVRRDVDDAVLLLKKESTRAAFHLVFKRFAQQMDIILPDTAAQPFIADLTFLGKVQHAARNRYRDAGLTISDAGEKVRRLVDEHIISTGVDPTVDPIDLLAAGFKTALFSLKDDESRSSEIESALKHPIAVKLEEDPEYYRSLSLRLQGIIEKTAHKWDQQLELLLTFRDTLEATHAQTATDLGLSDTELAFYHIFMAEVATAYGESADNEPPETRIDDAQHERIKATTQALVVLFDEATPIVDFFNKPDAIKQMKKAIKRALLAASFEDKALIKTVQERFMRLAQVRFQGPAS